MRNGTPSVRWTLRRFTSGGQALIPSYGSMVSLAIWVISTWPGNAFARPNFYNMETRDSCGFTHFGLNK